MNGIARSEFEPAPRTFRMAVPRLILVAILAAFSSAAPAQVYRCESPDGVIFSDMPCGESAQEIEVEGMEPKASSNVAESVETVIVPDEKTRLNSFLAILRNQQESQIRDIDGQLNLLRDQASSADFNQLGEAEQILLNARISELETSRNAVLEEYRALISEAESRLQ